MSGQTSSGVSAAVVLVLLAVGWSTEAQGIRSVVEPRGRVFPSVGAGVTALKRDSAGHYYILAKPASVISVYNSAGERIGQIPNANSHGTVIQYAVDIDLGPDGSLFVADRGANAVEIFAPDGSLAAKVPVTAPTSVVALSEGQFAVTSLTSTHLVQIINERGKVIRSFGDPQYVTEDETSKDEPDKQDRIVDWGRITGDSVGGVYFAFTSLPNPTLRKYDRFGYVAYETALPENFFALGPSTRQDRVEVGLNLTEVSFSQREGAWVSLGSSGDIKFGGGVGMGLNQLFASGGNFGRGGGQQGWQQNPAGPFNVGNSTLGGTASGEISSQGSQFHLGVGSMSGPAGGGRGRRNSGSGGTSSDELDDQSGGLLQFLGNGNSLASGQDGLSGDLSFNAQDLGSGGASPEDVFGTLDANGNPLSPGIGFQPTFSTFGGMAAWSIFSARDFRPPPGGAPGGPGGPGGAGANSFNASMPDGAMRSDRPAGPGGFGGDGREGFFPHRRFGPGDTEITATARVNLGELGGAKPEKPEITAVSIDPVTQEMWAGIGDTLVGFSKEGMPIGVYYLTMDGGTPLRASAVLVEPDRLLIAADPWGIFEFDRPDRLHSADRPTSEPAELGIRSDAAPSKQ